jgi:hypothetical protein
MSRSKKSPLPQLALTTIGGKLDDEGIGIVAAEIVSNLVREFPGEIDEITASWDKIARTVAELALPLLAPRTSTFQAEGSAIG